MMTSNTGAIQAILDHGNKLTRQHKPWTPVSSTMNLACSIVDLPLYFVVQPSTPHSLLRVLTVSRDFDMAPRTSISK
jgi:hypothetical protein